jgi:hypothetical protein
MGDCKSARRAGLVGCENNRSEQSSAMATATSVKIACEVGWLEERRGLAGMNACECARRVSVVGWLVGCVSDRV